MNHGEGHPIMHACLQVPRDERDAMAGQIVRFDKAMACLAGDLSEGEVAPAIKEAANALSNLYEFGKTSWCNCRVASWYHRSLVELQRYAVKHLGEKVGVERVPVNWTPLT